VASIPGFTVTDQDDIISISKNEDPKTPISAQRAVLISSKDELASEQHLDEVLFHGPKELNVRVDVGNNSTAHGELLPAPWSADGKISELYLMRGGKFIERVSKISGGKSEFETVKDLKGTEKLGTYVQDLMLSDQELKRLHASHIPKESKAINFESVLHTMGLDKSCEEILVKKIACKALINSPATGYDIVGDLVVAMTKTKSDAVPGGYQRRMYFFHVRYDLEFGVEFDSSADLSLRFL
jgi:hypothetical protein